MRIALITDRPFGAREQAMLSRLEVGLTHEGVRVVRAWPGSAPAGAPRSAFASAVAYADEGLRFTLPLRAAALAQALEQANPATSTERPIDLVHAFGEGCWDIASHAAELLDAPLVLEVWSPAAANAAARIVRRVGSPANSDARAGAPAITRALLASDATLAEACARAIPGAPVRIAPWGVHASEEPRPPWTGRDPALAVAAIVIGSGADERACAGALTGLAGACEADPRLTLFVDAAIVRRRRSLWRSIKSAGALGRFSLVEGLEARRDLTVRADLLIQPEALGERRSVTLDALASGLLVLARRDAGVPALSGEAGSPAALVEAPSAEAWRHAALAVLRDPSRADEMRRAGAEWAAAHAAASAHVRATLDAYEWIVGAGALPFAAAR